MITEGISSLPLGERGTSDADGTETNEQTELSTMAEAGT